MTLPKGLPATIKLGAVDVTLTDLDKVTGLIDGHRGSYDPEENEIKVGFDRGKGAAVTLLHEMCHAIWAEAALGGKEKREEQVVAALSAGLAAAMRDNPAVFDWITTTLGK